jgi:hypothetical protein
MPMPRKEKSPTTFFLAVSAVWGFYIGFSGGSLKFGIPSLSILFFTIGLYLYWRY